MLRQYALEHGHDILYVFCGDCDFDNRQFLAIIDFLTNYDVCQGVLIYSAEDVCQNQDPTILKWFVNKVNNLGKSFYSIVPLKVDSTSYSISKLDAVFLTKWTELESKVEDIYKPYPQVSFIAFEKKCFARCRFCYQTQNPNALVEAKMDMGLFKKIIDDMPSDASQVTICPSGETLSCPDVLQMVKYVSDTKPHLLTDFPTNGVLLDEERAKAIIKSGLKVLVISINAATRDDYRWFMGIDAYDQVVRNVKNFVQLRNKLSGPTPRVLARLQNKLVDTTSRIFVQLRNKTGGSTPRVLTRLASKLISPSPIPKVTVLMVGLKRFEHQIENFLAEWKGVADEVIVAPVCYCKGQTELENIDSLKAPQFPIVPTCIFLMRSMIIMPDGRLRICPTQDFRGEKYGGPSLGNARDTNLFTLWQSDAFNELRKANIRGLPVIEACLTCDRMMHDFETDLLMKSKLRKQFGINSPSFSES